MHPLSIESTTGTGIPKNNANKHAFSHFGFWSWLAGDLKRESILRRFVVPARLEWRALAGDEKSLFVVVEIVAE